MSYEKIGEETASLSGKDKVMEKFKAGLCSKKIPQALNIWRTTGHMPSFRCGKSMAQLKTYKDTAAYLNFQAEQGEHWPEMQPRGPCWLWLNCLDPQLRWGNLSRGQLLVVHCIKSNLYVGVSARRKPVKSCFYNAMKRTRHMWKKVPGHMELK